MFNRIDFTSLFIEFIKRKREGTNRPTVASYCAERCFKCWSESAIKTKKQLALAEKVWPKNRSDKCNNQSRHRRMVRDICGARWRFDHKFLLYRIMTFFTQETRKEILPPDVFPPYLRKPVKEGQLHILRCYSREKLLAYLRHFS